MSKYRSVYIMFTFSFNTKNLILASLYAMDSRFGGNDNSVKEHPISRYTAGWKPAVLIMPGSAKLPLLVRLFLLLPLFAILLYNIRELRRLVSGILYR